MPPMMAMEVAASSMPSSIEPVSPMNIRAGCQLWARKPRQIPTVTIAISAGAVAPVSL